MIALSADPDFRFKKVTGVMSDAAVSMRDPAFYSYHLFMDNIFELHKERLPPYTVVGVRILILFANNCPSKWFYNTGFYITNLYFCRENFPCYGKA